ncbi:MAG: hypothetical protein QOD74_1841 [Variibacter sp.]|jgi:hypothetical protein|nr:hypothetical protein [Variibacter sp.]
MATATATARQTRTDASGDTADIEAAIWTYLDGLYEGDADKIGRVFHPVSHLYSEENGEVADLPRDAWLERVRNRASAKSQGQSRHDRILSIDQSGPNSAFVKLECALPPRFFVDYLTLLKTAEGWQIVAKAFKAETR